MLLRADPSLTGLPRAPCEHALAGWSQSRWCRHGGGGFAGHLPCCQAAAWQGLHAAAGTCGSVNAAPQALTAYRPYSLQALHYPRGLRRLAGTLSGPAHNHAWRPAGHGECCRPSEPCCPAPTWLCKACCRAARRSLAATCSPGPTASRPPSPRSTRSTRRGPAAVAAQSDLAMFRGVRQRTGKGQDAGVPLSCAEPAFKRRSKEMPQLYLHVNHVTMTSGNIG